MTQKYKKLNPFTDMRGLGVKLSGEQIEQLQQERLRRFPVEREVVKEPAAVGVMRETLYNQPPLMHTQATNGTAARNPLIPPTSAKALLLCGGKKFWRAVAPILSVFVASCLIGLSIFPLLQTLQKQRKVSQGVLGTAIVAYQNLQGGGQALFQADFESARGSLEQAYHGFERALAEVQELGSLAATLPQTREGQKLLYAGQEAALALQSLTVGLGNITAFQSAGSSTTFADIRLHLQQVRTAVQYAASLKRTLDAIEVSAIDGSQRDKLLQARQALSAAYPHLQTLLSLQELFLGLLGGERKEYLLLFQNPRELRPTGGFIGTYGLLTLEGGEMKDLKIESVYNPDGQLKEFIAPPGPMQRLISKEWGLRDSNWFFDFPASARKAAEFFYKGTGHRVDGVLAFTPAVFERLLAITGPIVLSGYNTTVTAENFTDEVQYRTSVVYDRQLNQPKKFLADFAPLLLARLQTLDSPSWLQTLDVLVQSLLQKDILLFSFDTEQQARHEKVGWSGNVRTTSGDYLAVVHANVGAGKTDQNISQQLSLAISLADNGMVRHRLVIKRVYTAGKEKDFPINVDYMRIYVPAGSRLLAARGFDSMPFYPSTLSGAATDPDLASLDVNVSIDATSKTVTLQESGKTVFANWIMLAPGASREVVLEYETPGSVLITAGGNQSYSLLVQKQPGAPVAAITTSFELPAGRRLVWKYPARVSEHENQLEFKDRLSSDLAWGVIFQ